MSIASSPVTQAPSDDVRIGEWTLDARHNELRRAGRTVRLEPKATEVLSLLAGRAGMAVGREELLSAVWPGVVVGDDALTQAIIKLRRALGDDAHAPTYIETISKGGYRLIAAVSAAKADHVQPGSAQVPRRKRAWIAAVVALAAVGALVAAAVPRLPWPFGATEGPAAAQAAVPTVAILPFANLSGDPRRDYFSDGITEDMINALGRFSGVRVMSRRAVEPYRGRSIAPAVIRNELGARYIVQGSVREADGRIRVAVELSDAQSGALLASETRDGEGAQVFEIQDHLVRNIVGKLQVKLTQLELQRAFSTPTGSLEAYDLVLRARALLDRTQRSANLEARLLLARAQQLAPDYADIPALLGSAEFQRATDGWVEDAAGSIRRAEALAKQTLATGDSRAHVRAHSLLASIYSHEERYEEALVQARAAIELNPSDAAALWWRGSASLCVGRIEEAIGFLEAARRFEPRPSPGQHLNLALAYYVAGRNADALVQADETLAVSSRNGYAHAMRAAALARLGKLDEARRAADEVRRLDPLFDPDNFGARFADRRYTAQVREGLRLAGL